MSSRSAILDQIRRQLGLTQAELGHLMGILPTNIARIERGDRAPTRQQASALRRVARLADCNRALAGSG